MKYIKTYLRKAMQMIKSARRTAKGILYKNIYASSGVSIVNVKIKGYRNCWYGYYSDTCFNPENSDLIVVHANNRLPFLSPQSHTTTDIIIYNWREKKVVAKVGKTKAWNWQQGARAQWISNNEVIYNIWSESDNKYKCRIVNYRSGESKILSYAIQAIDEDGYWSVSYEALAKIRPDYGYFAHREQPRLLECELLKVSWCGEVLRRFSVESMIKALDVDKSKVELPKINHVICDKGRVFFLLRYFYKQKRITTILTVQNGRIEVLVSDCGASHWCFQNNGDLLITMRHTEGFGYYGISEVDGSLKIENLMKFEDGHPVLYRGDSYITDTYPCDKGFRRLLLLRKNEQHLEVASQLLKIKEPIFYTGVSRCDLHPSVSSNNQYIQIDIANMWSRQVLIVSMDKFCG